MAMQNRFLSHLMALLCLLLLFMSGCKGKEESSISAEDILRGADSLAAERLKAAQNAETVSHDLLDEPEEISKPKAGKTKIESSKPLPKRVVNEPQDFATSNKGAAGEGIYAIQVNVFSLKRPAERLSEKLSGMGYHSYVAEVESPVQGLNGIQYRVRVGGFQTRNEARKCGEELNQKLGLDFWIDYRKNDNTTDNYSTSAPYQESWQATPPPSQPEFPQQQQTTYPPYEPEQPIEPTQPVEPEQPASPEPPVVREPENSTTPPSTEKFEF